MYVLVVFTSLQDYQTVIRSGKNPHPHRRSASAISEKPHFRRLYNIASSIFLSNEIPDKGLINIINGRNGFSF